METHSKICKRKGEQLCITTTCAIYQFVKNVSYAHIHNYVQQF